MSDKTKFELKITLPDPSTLSEEERLEKIKSIEEGKQEYLLDETIPQQAKDIMIDITNILVAIYQGRVTQEELNTLTQVTQVTGFKVEEDD